MVLIVLAVHAFLIKKSGMNSMGDWIQLISTQLAATGLIIFVTVVLFSADIFSEDYSLGTIKMLFVRPQKRILILMSKLGASFSILIFLSLIALVISAVINTFLFDAPLLNQYIPYETNTGEAVEKSYILYTIQMFLANIVEIGIYIFIASMLAIIFKHSSVAIIICLVGHFAISPILSSLYIAFSNLDLSKLILLENIVKSIPYIVFYNTDLSKYIINVPNSLETSIWFSIAVLSAYVALFLFISYKIYCKRDVY